jgi:hypothetical protein
VEECKSLFLFLFAAVFVAPLAKERASRVPVESDATYSIDSRRREARLCNVRVWAICHVVDERRAVKIFDRTLRSSGDITRARFDAIIS